MTVNKDVAAIRVKIVASRSHLVTRSTRRDCIALVKYKAAPRSAKLGLWTAAQHLGVLRSFCVRGWYRIPGCWRVINSSSSIVSRSSFGRDSTVSRNTSSAQWRVLGNR